ncbi:Hypothetical cytosolic protein [Lacticaseibacillus paracasei]|nr:Hypothetical cytosolic protein [Lacticaseibacillus paracasei]
MTIESIAIPLVSSMK